MAVTKLTVEPMLSFITKVTAVKVATSLANSKRLREQVCVFFSALCRTGCSMCEFDPGSQLRSRASYRSGNAWCLRCYKLYASLLALLSAMSCITVQRCAVSKALHCIDRILPCCSTSQHACGYAIRQASIILLVLQAFATPERLAEMVQKVQTAMQSVLPKVVRKMKLYLNNPSTHSILFKPIKSNIAEAHAQIAALLEAEYTQQEVQSIQLTTPSALEKLLAL